MDDQTDTLVGVGNTVPVVWDGTVDGLPGGIDDVLTAAIGHRESQPAATTLCALQAALLPGNTGQGLSTVIIQAMRDVAARRGLVDLIAPVRPNQKALYPLTPMERYIALASAGRPAAGRLDAGPCPPRRRDHADRRALDDGQRHRGRVGDSGPGWRSPRAASTSWPARWCRSRSTARPTVGSTSSRTSGCATDHPTTASRRSAGACPRAGGRRMETRPAQLHDAAGPASR